MPAAATAPLGKLAPPRVARAFARKRLFGALDRAADCPFTWIAGPPGAGKTTLVSSWLAARKRQAVWMQLDAADSDPATFFHYLTRGLAQATRTRAPEFTDDDRRDVAGFARRYFRRVAELLGRPWTLVLDNYQEIAEDSALHACLAIVLDELTIGTRWIAVSRAPPPPAFARARSTQALAMLDANALRFSLEEAGELAALHGKTRTAEEIHRATDGWAAGMVLMLVATESETDALPASRETVFDYFAAEVLARMPPAHQVVLMRVAFFSSATESMAVALTGEPEAGKVLATLARRNLFTDRRAAAEPVYVFHALFRAFLQARAIEALTPEALVALRERAADLLAEQGEIDAAIDLYLIAGAGAAASRLIDRHAARLLDQGRAATVGDWITRLPAAAREAPKLRYWHARSLLGDHPQAASGLFEAAFEQFERAGDEQGALLAAAGAAECIVLTGKSHAPLDRWLAALDRYADGYLATRDAETEALVLPAMLAAFTQRQPGHRLTMVLADRAARLLDDPRFAGNLNLLGSLAYVFTMRGEMPRFDHFRERLEALREKQDSPVAMVRWYGASLFFRAVVGDTARARAEAEEAVRFLATLPDNPLKARVLLRAAHALGFARDPATATRLLDEAARLIGADDTYDRSVYEHMRANIALLGGDTAAATRHFERCLDAARAAGRPTGETVMIGNAALAAIEHGDYAQAERLLERARASPALRLSPIIAFGTALVEAHLADRTGERERAIGALRSAFAISRATGIDYEGYIFVLGLMPRLAALALAHDVEPEVVRRMIRRHAIAPPALDAPGWPWPIRIFTLGRFAIERDGEPLPQARKESKKPLELLKLLVAAGEETPGRLMHALWPEAEGDRAKLSFDGALLRLRRMIGVEGAIELKNGIVSLNRALVWTDLAALEAACARLDAGDDASLDASIDEFLDRVLALYRGRFLPADESLAPLAATRERVRTRLLRTASAVGERLERAQNHEAAARLYQRVLEQDVLAEEIYRRLIACQIALGRQAEAYDTFRRCRDNLSIILGIKPQAETLALAARVRGA